MPCPAMNLRSRKKAKKKKTRSFPKRPYNCDLCKYSTCIQDRMVMHIVRTHLAGKPLSCNQCSYKTSERNDYKKHLRSHVGGGPYECNVCEFITNQAMSLENHSKMHTKEQPYGCDQCEFRTSEQNSLLMHLKTHNIDKSPCFLCDNDNASLLSFTKKRKGCRLCRLHCCACSNLTTLHLCALCQKDCMERWSYRRTTIHLTTDSKLYYNYVNGVLSCNICGRTFKAKIGYFSHMQTHLKNTRCLALSLNAHREYRLNNCR